jgi:glycosyltransferase involved in cell wall biosynthesis
MQKNNCKISVITGYFNRSNALDLTIDSIMNQSFSDFELLVFDDASTDDTKQRLSEIINRYNDSRLKVIYHKENKGFVQGMIDAISLASGDYICIQGSGDYSDTDRLKEQCNVLDAFSDVGVVGCYYENVIEDSGISRMRYKDATNITFKKLLTENIFSHGEVMFRRSVYDSVGGYRPEFINCQDYDLWLRMIKITKFSSVKKCLYKRYVRYDGVSYNPKKFLKQVRYERLCRVLAEKNEYDQSVLLKKVSKDGIINSVPLYLIRKNIYKSIIKSLVWNKKDAAIELSKMAFDKSIETKVLTAICNLFFIPLFYPLRRFIQFTLGTKVKFK